MENQNKKPENTRNPRVFAASFVAMLTVLCLLALALAPAIRGEGPETQSGASEISSGEAGSEAGEVPPDAGSEEEGGKEEEDEPPNTQPPEVQRPAAAPRGAPQPGPQNDGVQVSDWATLKNAVESGSDAVITVAASFTAAVGSGNHIIVARPVTIVGTGGATITRTGATALFLVNTGGALTLQNLTLKSSGSSQNPLLAVSAGQATLGAGSVITGGDRGGVLVAAAGTLTVDGGSVNANNSNTSGAGVYNVGTMVLNSGAISGNTAPTGAFGGGIYNTGSLTINGGAISGNSAPSGAGVYHAGTQFAMTAGTISGNTASANGGGVYVDTGKTFSHSGGTIGGEGSGAANTAANGGGVCNMGSYTLSGAGVVNGNSAMGGYGGGVASSGTFTMQGGTISGNTAATGGGGAAVSGSGFAMSGGGIKNNTASGAAANGGGVWVRAAISALSVTGGELSGNAAGGTGSGGGVYVANSNTLALGSAKIAGNTAGANGQDVAAAGSATVALSGKPVVGTVGSGGLYGIASSTVQLAGTLSDGALVVYEGSVNTAGVQVAKKTSGNLEEADLDAFRFMDARYASTSKSDDASVLVMLDMTNLSLQQRVNLARAGTAEAPFPIALGKNESLAQALKIANLELGANTPRHVLITGYGITRNGFTGAMITVPAGSTLILQDIELTGTNDGTNNTIRALVDVAAGGTLTIANGAVLQGNSGRGVMAKGTVVMTGGEVKNNSAASISSTSFGGGFYLEGAGASLDVSGGSIAGNTAAGGGGVYALSGAVNIRGGQLTGNTATGNPGGGAAYIVSNFTMTGGKITGNSATRHGGGVLLWTSAAYTVQLTGGEIVNNEATGAASTGGGVQMMGAGTKTLAGVLVQGNHSAGSGGGVAAMQGTLVLGEGTRILGNRADKNGGGVLVGKDTALPEVQLTGAAIGGDGNDEANTAGGMGTGVYIDENNGALKLSGSFAFGGGNGIVAAKEAGAPIVAGSLAGRSVPIERIPYNEGGTPQRLVAARADGGYTLTADDLAAFTAPGYTLALGQSDTVITGALASYSITYNGDLKGATNPNTATEYTIFSETITLQPLADVDGFRFAGWYDDETGGSQVASIPKGSSGDVALWARWTPVFTLRYVKNTTDAVTNMPAGATCLAGESFVLGDEVPAREGYRFDGWATSAGGAKVYEPEDEIDNVDADVTLYARWVRQATLRFSADEGASGVPPAVTLDAGTTVDLAGHAPPSWSGRVFTQWSTEAGGGGTIYAEDGTLVLSDDVTLYANWRGATRISFDAQDSVPPQAGNMPEDRWHITGQGFTLPNSVPQREGYKFLGWRKSAGSVAEYGPGQSAGAIGANTTFYAVWERQYQVFYDGNGSGATGVPSDANWYDKGSTPAVAAGVPSRPGYEFTTWNTEASGSGDSYAPGARLPAIEANVQLYAQWIGATKINYHANGSGVSGLPEGQRVVTGEGATLRAGEPAREGYRFNGWNSQADGGGTDYAPGQTLAAVNADLDLYARWVKTYTVGYDFNSGSYTGGGDPFAEVTQDAGTSYALPVETPELARYEFDGWNTKANGGGDAYSPGDSIAQLNGDVTLYAQWVGARKVTLWPNGGDGTEVVLRVPTGDAALLPPGAFVRDGYRLAGWNSQPDGQGPVQYGPGAETAAVDSDFELYAQWVRAYTLRYDANGGSGAPRAQQADEDTAFALSAGIPARPGHTFAGWNTAADGSGDGYQPGDTHPGMGEDSVLYAQWRINRFTLRYHANGGSGAPAATPGIAWGSTVRLSGMVPQRGGYVFEGWNSRADGSGTSYQVNEAVVVRGELALYAQWSVVPAVSGGAGGTSNSTGGYLVSARPSVGAEVEEAPEPVPTEEAGEARQPGTTVKDTGEQIPQSVTSGTAFRVRGLGPDALQWDSEYFDVEYDAERRTYTFTPKKAGRTTVVLVDEEGNEHSFIVTISAPGTPVAQAASGLPWPLLAGGTLALAALGALAVLLRRNKKRTDGSGGPQGPDGGQPAAGEDLFGQGAS